MTAQWFLVHAQTGREFLAEEHLRRQGYETFTPASFRAIRHARKIRNVRCAYFPGYLFVSLDLGRDRWSPINGTVGVIRILCANNRPIAAPGGLVESLIAACDPDGVLELARDLQPGQAVRMIRGPFADQLGAVERLPSADRVRVLLTIMSRAVAVEVGRADLAAA